MVDKRELEQLRSAIRTIENGAKNAPSGSDASIVKRIDGRASGGREGTFSLSDNADSTGCSSQASRFKEKPDQNQKKTQRKAFKKAQNLASSEARTRHRRTLEEAGEVADVQRLETKAWLVDDKSELSDEGCSVDSALNDTHEVTSGMLRQAALSLLAQREQSEGELLRKLGRRFPGFESLKAEVIAQLQSDGLQSDARLAESYVRYRSQRGQGPNKIRNELSQKGVASSLITESLNDESIDWVALARFVVEKRFGESLVSSDLEPKERARRSRFLQQRGFHYEHISAAL